MQRQSAGAQPVLHPIHASGRHKIGRRRQKGKEAVVKRSVRFVLLLTGVFGVATTFVTARASQGVPTEITVAVTNVEGQPVRELSQEDFTIVEDGRRVAITGFRAITEVDAAVSGRTIVLLLGGPGAAVERTADIQAIARDFLSRAGRTDRVSVVRYGNSKDELTGGRPDMLMRVAEFRIINPPPLYAKTQEDVLDEVARIANELEGEDIARGRQAIVWIGSSQVFDVTEPALGTHERLWPYWVKALSAAGRAGVSVYVVDPHGLTGRVRLNPDGLVAHTGGAIFDNTNRIEAAVDRIWNELGSHYVLEYAGAPAGRDLHAIEVTVSEPGAEVRARRSH